MSIDPRVRWACVCALALAASGCQSYNFNPVKSCVIQPGTERVTLSSVSSADVLFVVDDSRSMDKEQQSLATNFSAFIDNLDNANAVRRKAGLEPFDFHIAVTTTSVFWNYQSDARPGGPYTCTSTCSDAPGQKVCCRSDNKAARAAMPCTSNAQCTGTGVTCGPNCVSPFTGEAALTGENYCCVQGATGAAAYPTGYTGAVIPCSIEGTACGTFEKHYNFQSCTGGLAANGWPYPQGDFVSYASGATVNPRVLHFDKSLYPPPPSATATLNKACAAAGDCSAGETCVAAITSATGTPPKFCRSTCTTSCAAGYKCVASACQPVNAQGFTSQQLVDFFAGTPQGVTPVVPGNVIVGTCGSGEETSLAAAQAAIEKARDGLQKDTYGPTGGAPTWVDATRTATSPASWFNRAGESKLVVVFVGDADDCSPKNADPSGAVVWDTADYTVDTNGAPMGDSCSYDATRDAPLGHKQKAVDDFVAFFTGLGRKVGAGFIFPTDQYAPDNACTFATCTSTTAQNRCCPPTGCTITDGAQSAGTRLFAAAHKLAASGADVVAGSICDPTFASTLDDIADIVKPPSGLTLPTMPAADEVTILRIAYPDGKTRTVCKGPLGFQSGMTLQQAQETRVDWWFTATPDPAPPAVGATQNVYINPSGACIANPGETYSADYVGQLPKGGCWNNAAYTPLGHETQGDAMCRSILGGAVDTWTCFAGEANGVCATPTLSAPGTCICGSRADNGCAP